MTQTRMVLAPVSQRLVANPVNLLTTELNSLANLAGTVESAQVDPDGWEFGWFELLAGFAVAPAADSPIDLILLPVFAANKPYYASGAAAERDGNAVAGTFKAAVETTARRYTLQRVVLPPFPFTVAIVNRSAQALAASGNILKLSVYGTSEAQGI